MEVGRIELSDLGRLSVPPRSGSQCQSKAALEMTGLLELIRGRFMTESCQLRKPVRMPATITGEKTRAVVYRNRSQKKEVFERGDGRISVIGIRCCICK
jgi:hypothetical protein